MQLQPLKVARRMLRPMSFDSYCRGAITLLESQCRDFFVVLCRRFPRLEIADHSISTLDVCYWLTCSLVNTLRHLKGNMPKRNGLVVLEDQMNPSENKTANVISLPRLPKDDIICRRTSGGGRTPNLPLCRRRSEKPACWVS